ncbi:fetuin B [Anguilla rostrata]|uniref:fetuin B n=1 Tax=Anguilla rostrata TaxID=7938 RepID=UPI0030D078A2
MKCNGSLLPLLLFGVCVYAAPVDPPSSSLEPGNCLDPFTRGAAEQALTRINRDRRQGYVFSLKELRNAHHMKHGPTGVVFYLTLDVLETKCHVLSKRDWKSCEVREEAETPVYGQCKATVYINKVKRIVRLYRYNCIVRPAPASRIVAICPDCPSIISHDDASVLKTVKMALEKYNKESGNANYFGLLNITRASMQGGIADFTFADFTIQETVCSNGTNVTQAAKCGLMDCEFAHTGHCSASYFQSPEEDNVKVNCDIFEPEEAKKEKQRHLLGGELDHGHNHTHGDAHKLNHTLEHTEGHEHTHGEAHEHDHTHGHGHVHYHSHEHDHAHHHDDHAHAHNHSHEHDHADDHTHDHAHAHNHTHDPAHKHEHAHDHAGNGTHDHAHDHIHYYGDHHHHHHHHHHGNHTHAHEHDHDHQHDHGHLHAHEHHHHHHDHDDDQQKAVRETRGEVRYLPDLDKPAVLPSFPDQPELERPAIMPSAPDRAVPLPAFPDAEPPEEQEPPILPFPGALSPQCAVQPKRGAGLVDELFAEDPLFKPSAAAV